MHRDYLPQNWAIPLKSMRCRIFVKIPMEIWYFLANVVIWFKRPLQINISPLHQRAYFSFWQGFHLFLLFGTQFFAWCFLSIFSWILEGFKCDPTKKLRCLDTFFNFWPFLLVGKATSLWQKLHWDSLWMQLFFLKPLQFKRLWVVPSWHEWGTHCAKTGLNPHPQSHNVMDACWISTQIVGFPTIL